MTSTTRTRSKVQIAAPINLGSTERLAAMIDLSETFAEPMTPTLDSLIAQDDVIVDVWDEETTVAFMSDEAVVVTHGNVAEMFEQVTSSLRRGWGREGDLPEALEVERHDERTPVEADITARTAFRPHVAGRTASWRLIEGAIHNQKES